MAPDKDMAEESSLLRPDDIAFSIKPIPGGSNPIPRKRGRPKKVRGEGEDEEKPARQPRQLLIPGTLDHAFHLVGGRSAAIEFTRLAALAGDNHLAEIITLYEELTPHQQKEANVLEQLCLAVGLHPSEFFGRVSAAAYRRNYDVAAFAAAAAAPLVIEKSMKFAAKESGFKDRQMLLQVSNVLEPRGPLVQVNQNSDNRQVHLNEGPSFEQLTAKVSEMLRGSGLEEQRLLTEGEIVHEDS